MEIKKIERRTEDAGLKKDNSYILYEKRESINLGIEYLFHNQQTNAPPVNNVSQSIRRSLWEIELNVRNLFYIRNVSFEINSLSGDLENNIAPPLLTFDRIKTKLFAESFCFLSSITSEDQLVTNNLDPNVTFNPTSANIPSTRTETKSLFNQTQFISSGVNTQVSQEDIVLNAAVGQNVVPQYTLPVPQVSTNSSADFSQRMPCKQLLPSLSVPFYIEKKKGFIAPNFTSINYSTLLDLDPTTGAYDSSLLPGAGFNSYFNLGSPANFDIDFEIILQMDIERWESYN